MKLRLLTPYCWVGRRKTNVEGLLGMPHAEDCRCPICQNRRSARKSAMMTVRLDPDVKRKILGHPKGARAYLETLIREEPSLHSRLGMESIVLMQERHAHLLKDAHLELEGRHKKVLEQNEVYRQALQRLADMQAGGLSQLAAQALAAGMEL